MAAACPAPARPAAPAAGGREKGRSGIDQRLQKRTGREAGRQAGMDEQMNGWRAGCRDASRERGRDRQRTGSPRSRNLPPGGATGSSPYSHQRGPRTLPSSPGQGGNTKRQRAPLLAAGHGACRGRGPFGPPMGGPGGRALPLCPVTSVASGTGLRPLKGDALAEKGKWLTGNARWEAGRAGREATVRREGAPGGARCRLRRALPAGNGGQGAAPPGRGAAVAPRWARVTLCPTRSRGWASP